MTNPRLQPGVGSRTRAAHRGTARVPVPLTGGQPAYPCRSPGDSPRTRAAHRGTARVPGRLAWGVAPYLDTRQGRATPTRTPRSGGAHLPGRPPRAVSSPRKRGPPPLHELPAKAFLCHPRESGDRHPYTNCLRKRSCVIPAKAGTATPTRTSRESVLVSSPRKRGPPPLHELPAKAFLCHPREGGDRYPYTNCLPEHTSSENEKPIVLPP
jgi:hypothetical protein